MAHAHRIRILILHDDLLTRAGLSATFQKHPDLEVVNPEDDLSGGPLALQLSLGALADVVVADYERGVDIARRTARHTGANDRVKIMIVATCDRECEIRSALELGVRGYVVAGGRLDDLASSVRAVHRGARHLCPRVAQRLAESLSGEALTVREEEVLSLVATGMNNKLVGRRLGIAVGTVKSHLKGIFEKLQVESRTQAIIAAERRGLLRDIAAADESRADSARNARFGRADAANAAERASRRARRGIALRPARRGGDWPPLLPRVHRGCRARVPPTVRQGCRRSGASKVAPRDIASACWRLEAPSLRCFQINHSCRPLHRVIGGGNRCDKHELQHAIPPKCQRLSRSIGLGRNRG